MELLVQRSWLGARLFLLLFAVACGQPGPTASSDRDDAAPPPAGLEPQVVYDYAAPGPPGYQLTPGRAPTAIVGRVESISGPEWDTSDRKAPKSSGRADSSAARYRWATVNVDRVLWEHTANEMPEGREKFTAPAAPTMRVVIWIPGEAEGGMPDPPAYSRGPEVDVGDRVLWVLYGWGIRQDGRPTPVAQIPAETAWTIRDDGMAVHEYWSAEPPVDADVLIERLLDAHNNPQNWTTGDMRNLMSVALHRHR